MQRMGFFICIFAMCFSACALAQTASTRETNLTIVTFYPAPEVKYNNVETNQLYSPVTRVNRELRKQITSPSGDTINIFRAFSSPVSSATAASFLQNPDNFTSHDMYSFNMPADPQKPSDIYDFLFNGDPLTSNINMILTRLTAVDLTGGASGSRLVTSNIENMLSLQVRGRDAWQEYNVWPGQGTCRTVSGRPFFGFIGTDCNKGEVLSDFWESPVGPVIVFHIGGGAHSWNNDMAIGIGGGMKVGLYGYTCCQVYQDREQAPLNLPCQDVVNQIDPSRLTSGSVSQEILDMFKELARHSNVEHVSTACGLFTGCEYREKTHCYASVSAVTYDGSGNVTNTCPTDEIGIAMDIRKPVTTKSCVCADYNRWGLCIDWQCRSSGSEYRVGKDGIDEYYCFSYDSIMGDLPGDDKLKHVPCMITALEATDGPDTGDVPNWLRILASLFGQDIHGLPDPEGVFALLRDGLGVSNDALCNCFGSLENIFGNWNNADFENSLSSVCH